MQSFGTEKAIVIRQPATANLMVDSKDRDEELFSSPWDFQITRPQALQNGFMTRIGTTEVVLEWYCPNIYEENGTTPGNNVITVDICGSVHSFTNTITIPPGFYSVAEVWNFIRGGINDLSGDTGVSVNIVQGGFDSAAGSFYSLVCTGGEFNFPDGSELLVQQLKIPFGPNLIPEIPLYQAVDLRRYRYLDFVSSQLTYNQDLKDNSTAEKQRDVLCRWYMAYGDSADPNVDNLNFPILMGYEPFVIRRIFNPPKQIKWDSAAPIGNLAFQVFGDDGKLVGTDVNEYTSEWLMTLQLSEN